MLDHILHPERITDRWSTLIAHADGRGAMVHDYIVRQLEDVRVPKLKLSRQTLSRKKRKSFSLVLEETAHREYLVVENEKMWGHKIYIGVADYGKQLSVQWYATQELYDWTRAAIIMGVAAFVFLAVAVTTKEYVYASLIRNLAFFIEAFAVYKIFKSDIGTATLPEFMDLLDLEELSNYVSTVHHAATAATEQVMKGMNLDFSQVDTQSKGFLKIT